MDKIKDLIQQLDKNEENWRTYIKMNDDSKAADVVEMRQSVTRLMLELRDIMKVNNQQKMKEVRELISDDKLSDNFFKNVETTLIHYKAMEPLRRLEKKDLALCKEFFRDIMSNYVVRWNRKLYLSYKKYHFDDSATMKSAMDSIDSLSDYYVGYAFANQSIREDFLEKSGLSEESCQVYADLVDEYYNDIKMNIIFNNIESLTEQMDKLEDAISRKNE